MANRGAGQIEMAEKDKIDNLLDDHRFDLKWRLTILDHCVSVELVCRFWWLGRLVSNNSFAESYKC